MTDDLGYGEVGCYGQKLIKTPCIDQMAREGTRFTDCYAGAPVCAPCRSVLMTGQHTGHTTVRNNKGKNEPKHDGQKGRIPLKADDVTVAEVLKKAGYATGMTGKWGLGEPGSTGLPNDHGFDEWLGYLNQDHAPHYYTDWLWHNKEKMILKGNLNGGRKQYTHDLFTEFALDFIRSNQTQPFFLYVPYCIPHFKLEVPSLAPYENETWDKDAVTRAAMITRMDRDVGRIFDLLKELDLDRDTIVFFCSDNGVSQRWDGLFDGCGPFREKKGSLYEGGIRIPMIVRWPGRTPAGRVDGTPWYLADVMPTLADIAGTSVPDNIDGVNVLPTLLGKRQDLSRRFMYWEKPGSELRQAVRWGKWKAVRQGQDNPIELYDLDKDIGETTDVADQHPAVVARID
ncbi:MAG: arylsulfatase, partial [Candidatus Hydrogenedentes bacterium]|nr:arylsulfatase [Candidatus Hydrogenedentota bacterium]